MSSGRVVLVGAVHECFAAFDALVGSPDCELVGVVTLTAAAAANVSGAVDIAGRAASHRVPVLRVDDVNAAGAVRAIARWKPDLIAVVGWTRLIREDLLDLPSLGCVGFHASLLPHNRGRAPVNWAIIRGESQTGNTMMLLNAGVDTGEIIDQRSTPIEAEDTCATVYERVATLGAQMLVENVGPLLRGESLMRPQDASSATVLPKRVPAMGVTDWSRSAQEVHDWIRAQTTPYPGAFTHIRGERITLWRSRVLETTDSGGAFGSIMAIEDCGVSVATGCGTLLIAEVSQDPVEHAPAHLWAEWAELTVGDRFDQPDNAWIAWSLGRGPRPEEGF